MPSTWVSTPPGTRQSCPWRLGTQTITPLELAKGYAVLANGGYRVEPFIIAAHRGS